MKCKSIGHYTYSRKCKIKQLEQHSIHLINQEAERKWRKPKKGLKHGSCKASDPNPTG